MTLILYLDMNVFGYYHNTKYILFSLCNIQRIISSKRYADDYRYRDLRTQHLKKQHCNGILLYDSVRYVCTYLHVCI